MTYHFLQNAAVWSSLSPPTEGCCLKCLITSYRRLLSEVPYHLLQKAAVWSAVSPPTEGCCLKCRITSYTTLLSEVPYHLLHNAAAWSNVSPPTERCYLKCHFASNHGANLPVIVFLHNTKQTCIQRDCFGRLGSECHSEPTAATVVSLCALKTVNMQFRGWVWSLAVRDVSYVN